MGDWKAEAEEILKSGPKHILFLCVANSSRSQIAEGIARSLAPPSIAVSSAGSVPTTVNPFAIRVMKEIGIDISAHQSKPVEAIDAGSVDCLITLCEEEVCPTFLRSRQRYHWGMADPAKKRGNEEAKLIAFRIIRDELYQRLSYLFGRIQNATQRLSY